MYDRQLDTPWPFGWVFIIVRGSLMAQPNSYRNCLERLYRSTAGYLKKRSPRNSVDPYSETNGKYYKVHLT